MSNLLISLNDHKRQSSEKEFHLIEIFFNALKEINLKFRYKCSCFEMDAFFFD